MLFAGKSYYPEGGFKDFKGYFNSEDEAKLFLQKNIDDCDFEWFHFVDLTHNIIIFQGYRQSTCETKLVYLYGEKG